MDQKFVSFVVPTVASPLHTRAWDEENLLSVLNSYKAEPREGYYSMFSPAADEITRPEPGLGDFKGFRGRHKLTLDCLALDFDSKDDTNLALADVRSFVQAFHLHPKDFALFESGSKGYHLYVHASLFGELLFPHTTLNEQIKRFAQQLKKKYKTLDSGIYDIQRKFRIPFSIHPKTGKPKKLIDGSWPLARGSEHDGLSQLFMSSQIGSVEMTTARSETAAEYLARMGEGGHADEGDGPAMDTFKRLRNKPCVEAIRHGKFPGERHNKLLLLTMDLWQSGHTEKELREKLKPFLAANPSSENESEIEAHLKVLRSGKVLNPFCKQAVRNEHCKAYCPVFSKLAQTTKDHMPLQAYEGEAPESYVPEYHEEKTEDSKTPGSGTARPKAPKDKKVQSQPPSELKVVNTILDQFGKNIMKQNKDVFLFDGKRWKHLDQIVAKDHLQKLVDATSFGKYKFKDIQSAYNRLMMHIPSPPDSVDMFVPNPYLMNFNNGCLELSQSAEGVYALNLREHRREDYLTLCHPFDFRDDAPPNEEFEATLDRVWEGCPDIEERKAAYFEVLGACLVPTFRKIVLFVGPPKTGKSTLIQFATALVHKELSCSVDPSQFRGFNLHSMAGKLMNYDSDIALSRSLSDSILKKVEDKTPIRIERKSMSDIYAPIPPMHLFGANKLPKSEDGAEVYDRRMIMLRCDNVVRGSAVTGNHTLDFASLVWRRNPEGIVARAIQGLRRLCVSGGHFTEPSSSKVTKKKWVDSDRDSVQLFLEYVREYPKFEFNLPDLSGQVIADFSTRVLRGDAWECFRNFLSRELLSVHAERQVRGRNKFFDRLEDLGIVAHKVDGHWYIEVPGVSGNFSESSLGSGRKVPDDNLPF
jgi:phage/plasmid-associated DNA primase